MFSVCFPYDFVSPLTTALSLPSFFPSLLFFLPSFFPSLSLSYLSFFLLLLPKSNLSDFGHHLLTHLLLTHHSLASPPTTQLELVSLKSLTIYMSPKSSGSFSSVDHPGSSTALYTMCSSLQHFPGAFLPIFTEIELTYILS